MTEINKLQFTDRLFTMNYASRMAVRVISYAWTSIQITATLFFLLRFSDVPWIFWLGVLSALYLVDRGIHHNKAAHSLLDRHMDKETLESYLAPRAKRILVSAYDKTSILGGVFSLVLARALLEEGEVKELLSRMEVSYKDFIAKTEEYANRKIGLREDL